MTIINVHGMLSTDSKVLNKNQKEQVNTALLQLGFSEKEVIVYLSVLQSSDASIPSLSKDTGLSRGTVYDVAENLKGKGFVAEIRKGKKRRLVAESPTNRFYSLLDTMHGGLERARIDVENILPIIKAINVGEDYKPQIRVYSGEKGFRQVWDEIFMSKEKSFLSIARVETFIRFGGTEFLAEIQKRKAKLGFSSRAINESSELAEQMRDSDAKYNRETRIVPKGFQFPSTEIIFGDKIAMFSTKEENIVLLIESKDFAETHRVYFEMLWKFIEK